MSFIPKKCRSCHKDCFFLCIKEYSEYAKINKGIAPVFIYTGALLGGWALGHIVGYFAG